MAAIGVMLESRTGLLALRRTLPRGGAKIATCRGVAALRRLLDTRLVDAIVVSPYAGWLEALTELRARLPAIPVIAFAPFRPDDGELLLTCNRLAVAAIAVEGVDDAVVGDVVARYSLTAARRAVLADAPRILCLTESLQLAAWNALMNEVERPVRTTALAQRLKVSREHLSRQFGAGGAPNIKRVIDLTRIVTAAQLLANPGYGIPAVVRILGFTSPSHLGDTAQRIASAPIERLGTLGPAGVLAAFLQGNTRSRP